MPSILSWPTKTVHRGFQFVFLGRINILLVFFKQKLSVGLESAGVDCNALFLSEVLEAANSGSPLGFLGQVFDHAGDVYTHETKLNARWAGVKNFRFTLQRNQKRAPLRRLF